MSPVRESVFGEAWLVLLLAGAFGAALAGVQTGLGERIERNKSALALRQIPGLLLGSELSTEADIEIVEDRVEFRAADGGVRTLQVVERELAGHSVLEVLVLEGGRPPDGRDPRRAGWVLRGSDQGYADEIELLIGLSADAETIRGLYVLSQKETPALGDGITREEFRSRFFGARTDTPLRVTRSAGEANLNEGRILALTAATISSRSVCDIVNRTVAEVKPLLETEGSARSK